MKKKIIYTIGLIITLIVSQDILADDNYDFSVRGLYYKKTSRNTVKVTYPNTTGAPYNYYSGHNSPRGDISIPSTVSYGGTTYTVTSIGEDAFHRCYGLTSVNIPNSVTTIEARAFQECTKLTSISISNSVTSIGVDAFLDCTGLLSVTIPNFVTSIKERAFKGCTSITTLTLGHSLSSTGKSAFYGCTSLTSVSFGNSVTTIGNYSFYGCTDLTSVTIPNSVTSIGANAFSNCTGLTSVSIGDSVISIGGAAFNKCTSLTSITIPNSVTSIGDWGFAYCTGLTSVSIGNSVNSIGEKAFYGCTGLTAIVIPNSVTTINKEAFYGCTGLIDVTIGNSVTSIKGSAFKGCTGLNSVTIPNSVTSIEGSAFKGCTGLTTVFFNAYRCTSMGIAFDGCTNLTTVIVGDSVKIIPNYAFKNCTNLDTVYMKPLTPPTISIETFENNARDRVFILNCHSYNDYFTNNDNWQLYRYNLRDNISNLNIRVLSSNLTYGSVNIEQQNSRRVRCDSTTVIFASANEGYHFGHWSNGDIANPDTISLVGDSTLTAYFCSLTAKSSDATRGTVAHSKIDNRIEKIIATATPGYFFDHWSNGSTANPDTISIVGDSTITAYFYRFTIQSANLTKGVVSHSKIGKHQEKIIAIENENYHFSHWSNGSTANPDTITLVGDSTITAYFIGLTTTSADATKGSATNSKIGNCLEKIVATANEGYHFDHWSNGSTANPDTITLVGDSTLTAYFIGLTTTSANAAKGGASHYKIGNCLEKIVATANEGYHFGRWSNGSTANPDTITLVGDSTLTAYFIGLTTTSANATKGAASHYKIGNCLEKIVATANEGYHFGHWSNGNTANPDTITLVGDSTLTAYFISLTTTSANATKGAASHYKIGNCLEKIVATANEGYHFGRWSNGDTANPDTITLASDSTVTAYFWSFSVQSADETMGSVSHLKISNGVEKITATANEGYHFSHWSNGSTANPSNITLVGDSTITAYFWSFSAQSADGRMGSVSHSRVSNGVEKIIAIANNGYHFSHWSNGSTANPSTITLVGDSTVTAYFWSFSAQSSDRRMGSTSHSKISNGVEKITATANEGYHFGYWSNGSTANPDTITLASDSTITAYFWSFYAQSTDETMGSVSHSKISNGVEEITATANNGYHFSHWSNGSTANPSTITLVGDSTVTAYFWSFSAQSADGRMGSVSHSKISNGVEEITATANNGYHFSHWSNGSTANPSTITLVGDSLVVAIFERNRYTLSANVTDASLGSVSYPNGDTALYLDTLTVVAHTIDHYHVDHWSGIRIVDSSVNKDTIWVIMNSDISVTCYFSIDRHTVTVAVNDIARGTVNPQESEFDYGKPCTLVASAYTGYTFKCWSNGVTANPYIFTVTEDVNLTAIFMDPNEESLTVTAASADPHMGSATANGFPSATVISGETVTLVATANNGYHFVRWNDNNTDATRTITVTSDMSFTAYFEADESPTEDIDDIKAEDVKVYARNGHIVVEGAEGETVRVFDIVGRTVKGQELKTGVYIVKIGLRPAKKIVVMR